MYAIGNYTYIIRLWELARGGRLKKWLKWVHLAVAKAKTGQGDNLVAISRDRFATLAMTNQWHANKK